jgi:hypothetical protein
MDDLLEELQRSATQRWNTRHDNPYVATLIEILFPYGERGMPRRHAIDSVEGCRRDKGLCIPKSFDEVVQSAFNQHCVTSAVFRRRNCPADGLFSSRRDGSNAIWVMHADRADAWLRAHKRQAVETV